MSQSDYIKYKRVKNLIQVNNEPIVAKKYIPNRIQNVIFNQPPVFNSSDYINYKEYTLENTVVNIKPVLSRVTPSGNQIVWDMDKKISPNCAMFIICNNTNNRLNRHLNSTIYSNPTPVPLNIKSSQNNVNIKTACMCALNKSYSQNNLCQCKTSHYYS